jgi:alpha-L-fucosidase
MDPFSYGYNRATPSSAYMNASTIVTSLIDIVSKNGNFLLDVGPRANGTIIDVEQDNLRQAGVWIKDHAEAIFNTTYWFITPEENNGTKEIRFTQTMDAFYIISLTQPNGSIVLDSPVPWVQGDAVTVVGGNSSGDIVPSQKLSSGSLMLNISSEVQQADAFAWVFKISYAA